MRRQILHRKPFILLGSLILLFVAIAIPQNSSAASPGHTSFCAAGNYLLLGSVITNGAGTRITSSYPGAIVGGTSPAELLALVGSEAGVTNELNATAHINAMSSLGRVLDTVTALATSDGRLTAIDLSADHSGTFPLGTYGPGVYKTFAAMNIAASAVITLDAGGDPNANFYFIAGNAMTVGAGVRINLANGAQASNVYWVAGTFTGDLTLGASTVLYGNFLVRGAATLGGTSQIFGRLMATGAVTIGAGAHIYGIPADTSCTSPTPEASVSESTSASPSASLTPEQVAAALLTDAHLLSQQTIATALATANNTLAQAQIAAASKLAIAELLAAEKLAAQKIALAALVSSSPLLPAAQTITFTDTTLMDGFASLAYSDFLLAKTLTESQLSGQFVTYGLFGNLPLGVTFDSKTGILSGVISKEAVIGFYPITIAAFSQGYATQVLNLNWRVLPAPITASATPTPSSSAVLTSAAVLSILFTDTTLVKGIIGRTYTDYVQAKTFSGNVYTEERVSYSLVGSLPAGLTFSSSTGYISGIILNGTTPGVYKVLVSAFAKGYPTQVYPYDFNVVSASAAVVTPTASPTPTTTSLPIPPTKIILMDTVWFDSGKSLLTSSSRASLNLMIAKLIKSPYKIVTVYGYTDAVKGKPHPTLSLARANVVRSYLLAKTNDIKVSAIGLGVAPTSTYSSKSLQQSRKAEIWVA